MKSFFSFSILFFCIISLFSQNDPDEIHSDMEKPFEFYYSEKKTTKPSDTINDSFIEEGTKKIVKSLFGSSKKLSNADSIINKYDAYPSFGIYKENYVVIGSEMFRKPTKFNSDAKFQVSIRQRITNSTLPFKTYFFLTYTQKAFWGVFQDSFPFLDLNYNPSFGLGKAMVYNDRLLGRLSLQLEHESNGKGGLESRSWNKISFGANLMINDNWKIDYKIWIPIVDSKNNQDIIKYVGWSSFNFDYFSSDKKYAASCTLVKRGGLNLNTNIILNFSARLFNDDNQYLFIEYYNGSGESLIEYNQYRQRLRMGIVIKPDFIHLY